MCKITSDVGCQAMFDMNAGYTRCEFMWRDSTHARVSSKQWGLHNSNQVGLLPKRSSVVLWLMTNFIPLCNIKVTVNAVRWHGSCHSICSTQPSALITPQTVFQGYLTIIPHNSIMSTMTLLGLTWVYAQCWFAGGIWSLTTQMNGGLDPGWSHFAVQ